jgi:hypothetical protein
VLTILMRAEVEGMVEVVPVVASGAWGRGAVVVGAEAQVAQPMMREKCFCQHRHKSRLP